MDKCPKRDKAWIAAQRWVLKEEMRPLVWVGFTCLRGKGQLCRRQTLSWTRKRCL